MSSDGPLSRSLFLCSVVVREDGGRGLKGTRHTTPTTLNASQIVRRSSVSGRSFSWSPRESPTLPWSPIMRSSTVVRVETTTLRPTDVRSGKERDPETEEWVVTPSVTYQEFPEGSVLKDTILLKDCLPIYHTSRGTSRWPLRSGITVYLGRNSRRRRRPFPPKGR